MNRPNYEAAKAVFKSFDKHTRPRACHIIKMLDALATPAEPEEQNINTKKNYWDSWPQGLPGCTKEARPRSG